jgi:hypothetical protein
MAQQAVDDAAKAQDDPAREQTGEYRQHGELR